MNDDFRSKKILFKSLRIKIIIDLPFKIYKNSERGLSLYGCLCINNDRFY